MKEDEIKERIDRLFPPEAEEGILLSIGKEIEKTKEFQDLVKARKDYPKLTTREHEISIWVHGIPEENYEDPFAFSAKVENLYTEFVVPVSTEYAGFAEYASNSVGVISEGDARLIVSRTYYGLSPKEPHPIKISAYPKLEELFAQLEEIEDRKMEECIRIWKSSKKNLQEA